MQIESSLKSWCKRVFCFCMVLVCSGLAISCGTNEKRTEPSLKPDRSDTREERQRRVPDTNTVSGDSGISDPTRTQNRDDLASVATEAAGLAENSGDDKAIAKNRFMNLLPRMMNICSKVRKGLGYEEMLSALTRTYGRVSRRAESAEKETLLEYSENVYDMLVTVDQLLSEEGSYIPVCEEPINMYAQGRARGLSKQEIQDRIVQIIVMRSRSR